MSDDNQEDFLQGEDSKIPLIINLGRTEPNPISLLVETVLLSFQSLSLFHYVSSNIFQQVLNERPP